MKIFVKLFVGAALIFTSTTIAHGYLMDLGGGGFYDTATGMYQNADGSIKSTTPVYSGTTQTTTTTVTPLGTVPPNNCIAVSGANQCIVNGPNGLQTVSFCTGTETSGPCRPERIDPIAAAAAAAAQSVATGQSCVAQMSYGFLDVNTALNYYYQTICSGSSGSSGSSGGSMSQSSGTSFQNYTHFLLGLTRSLIAQAQVTLNKENVTPPVIPPATGAGISGGTGGVNTSPTCYVFTRVLQVGATGADVAALTTALKREGFLSQITSTFDTNVMVAVKRFQEAHSTEILSVLGLTQGTGVVGEKTIAYLNSICVIPGVVNTICGETVRSDIQNGKYRYTFTLNTNGSWNVALDNPAYSISTDQYYVPANYVIIASTAGNLNIQNQLRFNQLSTLPGTAAGNTEYSNLYGSYINAYYDWDNMTKAAPLCIGQ